MVDAWDLILVDSKGEIHSIDLRSMDSKLWVEISLFVKANSHRKGEFKYEGAGINLDFIP